MLGIRFLKAQPTSYILQYQHGKVVREGAGLSFFYYAPTTSLVAVPMESRDASFIFNEVTADFQQVTIQGQLTYRITDAKKVASLLNFSLSASGRGYESEDPQKLPQRLVNVVNTLARHELQKLALRDAIQASDKLVEAIRPRLAEAPDVQSLGLEVLGFAILAIKPTPETSRALEAEAREQLLKEADEAIYRRRNSAVEQERAIKENELNTEIAVENKKRQIRETQMDAERAVQEKQHELQTAEMESKIKIEERNKALVASSSANARVEADARAYAMGAVMQALASTDPRVLQALASAGMDPEQLIASAFQEIATRADKIGELNISPDLLRELIKPGKGR